MSIIEEANRRLEQLRRSGIEVPTHGAAALPPTSPGHAFAPEKLVRKMESEGRLPLQPAAAHRYVENAVAGEADPSRRSKEVSIDLHRLAAMGFVTPDTPRAQIADEFRVIKRPLLANIQAKAAGSVERPNLIMVTSSVPGEGKTFVAVNLAISMAMELDKTVLLVDADVSRPSVLDRLALRPAPGCSTC